MQLEVAAQEGGLGSGAMAQPSYSSHVSDANHRARKPRTRRTTEEQGDAASAEENAMQRTYRRYYNLVLQGRYTHLNRNQASYAMRVQAQMRIQLMLRNANIKEQRRLIEHARVCVARAKAMVEAYMANDKTRAEQLIKEHYRRRGKSPP
ncbi:hypothetical protein IAT38_006336 [Cryptococcus sp. DSM 104549]